MAPMMNRKEVMKFHARCRDQDRQYEINNNAELDNGVYHKFVYSSKDDSSNKNREQENLLSRNSSKAVLSKAGNALTEDSIDLTKPQNKKKNKE